jgi:glycosidase
LKTRKENPIIIYGDYEEHYNNSDSLYVYERNYEGKRLLVVCSFTEKPVKFKAPQGFYLGEGKLLLNNYKNISIINNGFVTKPYETRVYLFE